MSQRTKIEWATHTWNPVTGCTKVSPGCEHCYAERMVERFGARIHGWDKLPEGIAQEPTECSPAPFSRVICHPGRLDEPLRWRKPRRVFVCSMSDLFHEAVSDGFSQKVLQTARACPQHTFMFLTKRPERMRLALLATDCAGGCNGIDCRHLWFGVSVEDQATANKRIPLLLQTPAAVRFVSYEPALGPVDFTPFIGGSDETTGERACSLHGRGERRAENRHPRVHLAACGEKMEPLGRRNEANSMPPAEGRERHRAVSTGANDVQPEAPSCASPSAGLDTLLRQDTGGDDYQSQEREQEGQQAGESRGGKLLGADSACDARPGASQEARQRGSVSWVICGGESGPGARPMHPDWARSVRDQCQAAGVPFFFKQWGEWAPCGDPYPDDTFEGGYAFQAASGGQCSILMADGGQYHQFSDGSVVQRTGKKRAGRLLDGREWNEVPDAR